LLSRREAHELNIGIFVIKAKSFLIVQWHAAFCLCYRLKKKYGFMAHNLLIYPQVDGHSHKKAGFSQPP
jgi:hypothetical protein